MILFSGSVRQSTSRSMLCGDRLWCLLSVAGLLLAPVLSGCGGGEAATGTIHGRVTFEGSPVPEARIQFQSPETGAAAASEVDSSGAYRVESPLQSGEYLVTVTPVDTSPPAGEGPAEPEPPTERTDIPERYRSTGTSGLKVTIEEGANEFDVELTAGE